MRFFQQCTASILILLFGFFCSAQESDSSSSETSDEVVSEESTADETQAEAPTVDESTSIFWAPPTIEPDDKGRKLIRLEGYTSPGTRVKVGKFVYQKRKKKKKKIRSKKVLRKGSQFKADAEGKIVLLMRLRESRVYLVRLRSKKKGQESSKYRLRIFLKKDLVKFKHKGPPRVAPEGIALDGESAKSPRFGVWLGSGINVLNYSQTYGTDGEGLSFSSVKSPSIYFRAQYFFSPKFNMSAVLKQSPGEVKASSAISVDNTDFVWQITSVDSAYYPDSWSFGNGNFVTGILAGVQQHQVPFIQLTGVNSISMKSNSISMATVGAQVNVFPKRSFGYEVFFRYQHPAASGDLFSITPSFAFDGSLGATYRFQNGFRLGAYWYGQYQTYDFNSTSTISGTEVTVTGKQTLLYSNAELRFGFEF